MSSFFKRIIVDAHGYVGSIVSPLRQKNVSRDSELSIDYTEPQTAQEQIDNLQSQPQVQSQTSITPSRHRANKQPDSKQANEGISTLDMAESDSQSVTIQSQSARLTDKVDDRNAPTPERAEDDPVEQPIGPPSLDSHGDAKTMEHTVYSLSSAQKGTDDDRTVHQNNLAESNTNAKSVNPNHTAFEAKKKRTEQQRSYLNTAGSQTENIRSLVLETSKRNLKDDKITNEKHQETDEPDTTPGTAQAPQTHGKNREAIPPDPISAHRYTDQARNSFLEGNRQTGPGLIIESREPVVHIGQIDIIIEAPPPAASSNKAIEPVKINSLLNVSTSFLRKL